MDTATYKVLCFLFLLPSGLWFFSSIGLSLSPHWDWDSNGPPMLKNRILKGYKPYRPVLTCRGVCSTNQKGKGEREEWHLMMSPHTWHGLDDIHGTTRRRRRRTRGSCIFTSLVSEPSDGLKMDFLVFLALSLGWSQGRVLVCLSSEGGPTWSCF